MKTLHSSKAVSRIATLMAVIAAGAVLVPTMASANTASNTTVRNTVLVDYADAGAVPQPQISDEVDVVVQLVAATPSVSAPADQTISPNSTATYSYTVYSNANGPDSYNITTPLVESGGLSGSTAAPSVTPVTLGATTVAVAPGAIALNTPTPITVPSDAVTDLTANVNQIVAGDVVVIGGVRCDVTAVTDSGTAGTGVITLSTITVDCDAGINPAVGAVIGEQRAFTVLVNPNGFTAPGPETVTVTATVRDALNAQPAATDVTITTVEELLAVVKYVRNVTTGVAGIAPTVTVDGNTYYASGVVGVPTNVLEYLIEVTSTSANSATDTVISDTVPAFTTFNATDFAVIDDAGVDTAVTPAEDNDAGETVVVGPVTTIYLYPGSTVHGDDTDGGTGNTNGDGGSVAAGLTAYGRFRVTID